MTVEGIDVSKWQATTPSLTGLDFLIARASIGTVHDQAYAGHVLNAAAAGLVTGAYHFADDRVSVAAQVDAFLAAAGDVGLYAVDIEGAHTLTVAQTRAFIDLMHIHGKRCGLYHSDSGFFDAGQDWDWVARWTAAPPKRHWDVWQYRGSPLDLDRYAGSRADLDALASGDDMRAFVSPDTPTVVDLPAGTNLYADSDFTTVRETLGAARTLPYIGAPARGVRIVVHGGWAQYLKDEDRGDSPFYTPPKDCTAEIAADRLKARVGVVYLAEGA